MVLKGVRFHSKTEVGRGRKEGGRENVRGETESDAERREEKEKERIKVGEKGSGKPKEKRQTQKKTGMRRERH